MKYFLTILSFSILCLLQTSAFAQTCAQLPDDSYEKNVMIGYGASELGVDLTTATSIGVSDFAKTFVPITGGDGCRSKSTSQAKISFTYARGTDFTCTGSITIYRTERLGKASAKSQYTMVKSEGANSACFPHLQP
jgi:hypothetical protein